MERQDLPALLHPEDGLQGKPGAGCKSASANSMFKAAASFRPGYR